jgi:hypothetical protein
VKQHRRFLRVVIVAGALLVGFSGRPAAQTGQGIMSLGGMTGLVNIPVADILEDATFRVGYAHIDRRWVYQLRPRMDNEVYFVAFGFLPRTEVTIRATIFPDETLLKGVNEPNVDRLASFRVLLVDEGRWPAVAAGADDVWGNRRFHGLYLVASKTVIGYPTRGRLVATAGYGADLLDAQEIVLDGLFGGVEVRPLRSLSAVLEYDAEKWNTALRVLFWDRLSVSAAFLNVETFSGGAAWTQRF